MLIQKIKLTKKKIDKIKIQKLQKKKILKFSDLKIPSWKLLDNCLTQSLINTFKKCPRKFFFAVNRLTNNEGIERSIFGNIIHFALDKLYSLPVKNIKNYLNVGFINNLILLYERQNQDSIQCIEENDFEYYKLITQIILEEYIKIYKKDFIDMKFIDTEKEIKIPFSFINLLMKIDGKYKTKDKKNFLIERKTKSRISEDSIMKVLSFDSQNLTYIKGAEKYYRQKVDGVLYDVIRKPQIKPHKGETLKDFGERLQIDIRKRIDFYFIRYEIPYTENDKEIFNEELMEIVNNIHTFMERSLTSNNLSVYYKNSIACEHPFSCEFLNVCAGKRLNGYAQKQRIFNELNDITDI